MSWLGAASPCSQKSPVHHQGFKLSPRAVLELAGSVTLVPATQPLKRPMAVSMFARLLQA